MAPDQHVRLTPLLRRSVEGPVATVTMVRPDVHNAFNGQLIAQLHDAFRTLGEDGGVRVIVLAGEGKSFSAGADLDWMRRAASFSEEENLRDAATAAALWRAVAECPKPVVARVHGNAFGGGAGLVAASDIAVAAESAMFGFTEVRLGLLPATVAPHVVEKIGPGRALPLFLRASGSMLSVHWRSDSCTGWCLKSSLTSQSARSSINYSPAGQTPFAAARSWCAASPSPIGRGSISTPPHLSHQRARARKAAREWPPSSRNVNPTGWAAPDVLESSHRESRRDRRPHHPHLPRSRHRDGRGVLGR